MDQCSERPTRARAFELSIVTHPTPASTKLPKFTSEFRIRRWAHRRNSRARAELAAGRTPANSVHVSKKLRDFADEAQRWGLEHSCGPPRKAVDIVLDCRARSERARRESHHRAIKNNHTCFGDVSRRGRGDRPTWRRSARDCEFAASRKTHQRRVVSPKPNIKSGVCRHAGDRDAAELPPPPPPLRRRQTSSSSSGAPVPPRGVSLDERARLLSEIFLGGLLAGWCRVCQYLGEKRASPLCVSYLASTTKKTHTSAPGESAARLELVARGVDRSKSPSSWRRGSRLVCRNPTRWPRSHRVQSPLPGTPPIVAE